ncbi:MAG TPA: YbhB/YbcL family Raf kinase inhibitor-like protein [Burkholderiales bacterium]
MKHLIAATAACALVVGCATQQPAMIGPATAFRLVSPGMADNTMLAPKYAGNFAKNPNCTGQNVSPALQWSNPPPKTKSYALIVDDQAGRNGLGVSHGVVYGIPADVTSFAEGELAGTPVKFVGGSSLLGVHYMGPCSPRAQAPHHYVFTLIATDLEPYALKGGMKRDELLKALEGHGLNAASLVLRFAQ